MEPGTTSATEAPAMAANSNGDRPKSNWMCSGAPDCVTQHTILLRGIVTNHAVSGRLSSVKGQWETARDILTNKCPHNKEKDAVASGTGSHTDAAGKKGDRSGDDDDDDKKKSVQSHTGNTGRLNVDTPNATFDAFSSGNHADRTSVVASADGHVTELTDEQLNSVLTQHDHGEQVPPIVMKQDNDKNGVAAAATGTATEDASGSPTVDATQAGRSPTVAAENENCTTEFVQSPTAEACNAHSQGLRALQQKPTNVVNPCTPDETPGAQKGKKGKNRAPAIMESPRDLLLKHAGGADIFH